MCGSNQTSYLVCVGGYPLCCERFVRIIWRHRLTSAAAATPKAHRSARMFGRVMPDTLAKDDLIDFLQQPLVKSLLAIHPNDILASEEFRCPDTWKPWWTWAAALSPDGEPPWISLLHVARDHSESSLDVSYLPVHGLSMNFISGLVRKNIKSPHIFHQHS